MNLPQRVLATTLAQVGGKVALGLAAIVSLRLTTSYLGVEGFGEFAIVLALVPFLAVLADLGIPLVLGRELARSPERADELGGTMLGVRIASSLGLVLVFLAAVPFLPYGHDVKVGLAVAAAGVGVAAIAGIPTAFFQLHVRLELAALVDIVAAVATVGLLIVATRLDLGFYAVVATLPAAALVAGASAFALSRRFWRVNLRRGWRDAAPLVKSALPLGLVTILGLLHFKVDSLMLSVMRPAEDLGVYTIAYRFLEQALILPGLLMVAVFPLLVRAVQNRSPDGKAILGRAVSLLLVVAVPLTLVLLVFAGPLVRLVAGEDFESAIAPLRILSLAIVPAFVNAPLALLLVALDRRRDLVTASITGLALNVGMNLWAIPAYGYTGAAVTTVVSEFVGVALVAWFARRAYPFEFGGLVAVRRADLRLILGR